jgi:hypothetical protein
MPQIADDIVIDAEFAALIPPLSAEERQQLEDNIVEHGGARDPLVVWGSDGTLTLLDGHNRYEICTRLGLPFDVHEMRFSSRDEAEDWIDKQPAWPAQPALLTRSRCCWGGDTTGRRKQSTTAARAKKEG